MTESPGQPGPDSKLPGPSSSGPSGFVVTLDGPAGAGKSTITGMLARRLGAHRLETGALYRAVALLREQRNVPWEDEEALTHIAETLAIQFVPLPSGETGVIVEGSDQTEALRQQHIGQAASQISKQPGVRAALLPLQRRLAQGRPLVVEGRDMGTVVFPHADMKFFLTASLEVRAQRRLQELKNAGVETSKQVVLQEVKQRDDQDRSRTVAPLVAAEDAIVLDSSNATAEEVVALALNHLKTAGNPSLQMAAAQATNG